MSAGPKTGFDTLINQADAFRMIFETLPLGVMVADQKGKLIFFNSAAAAVLGMDDPHPAQWTAGYGWHLPDKFTPFPPDRLPMLRAIHGEEVIDELIFVRTEQRSAGHWISISAKPLLDPGGSISGGVVTVCDVTERLHDVQTNILLKRVVEQTADNVVLTDKNGAIEYVNQAFETTTGYTRAEVLGKTPRVLKSGLHDDEFYRQLWTRINDGQPFQGMIINRNKAGGLYWAQQSITPVRNEAGNLTHFVSVSQDITALRKKDEQEFQLRLARDVQQQFYTAPPVIPGFDIGAAARPAYETGGDYFDFIPMPDGCLGIAVGDVAGHGFGSALLMALTRAYLRSFAAIELDLHEILAQVNQMLVQDLEKGRYVTLALIRLDLRNHSFSYASAGHVPGFVLRDSGGIQCVLESTGPPLGLFSDSKYSLQPEIPLDPGQIVVLLTDGITESRSPDGIEFGAERALDFIWTHRRESSVEIVNGLYDSARTFSNSTFQTDDITTVIFKVEELAAQDIRLRIGERPRQARVSATLDPPVPIFLEPREPS
jgi:sigma-B regulation protein RsbU (phosphoserine phosphatase)